MSLTSRIATLAGNIWISWRSFALFPWPAVVIGMPESKLTGSDFRNMLKALLPGDMILERGDLFRITNSGIPEKLTHLKHLAVYVGEVDGIMKDDFIIAPKPGKEYGQCIIHAISEGVKCQDIFELFRHCDEIVVIRPWKNSYERGMIISTAFAMMDLAYDFNFKSNNNSLYCTELGVKCLQAANIPAPKTVRTRNTILGLFLPFDKFKGDVYVADNFAKMFQVVFKSTSLK
jgi:hypothetical protein